MGDFKKLRLRKYPVTQEKDNAEAHYWKSFKLTKTDKLQGSPNCIDFNPYDSDSYIITSSTKISLYDVKDDKFKRAYSRFQDDAFSGKFRKDGKLIIAGDKSGYISVFDVHTKALLRKLKRHTSAVRSVCWTPDGLRMLSGSDDKNINVWDLGTQDVIWRAESAHTDYIRSVTVNNSSTDNFVSCGYDGIVNLWDSRQQSPTGRLAHNQPIEKSLISPSGSILITAGGNEVKLWDLISGGRLLTSLTSHLKNISDLCFDGSCTRFLSTGLDGLVKVYSMQTLQVVHGLRLGAPLLSIAMPITDNKVVLGFVDGNYISRSKSLKQSTNDDSSGTASTPILRLESASKFYRSVESTGPKPTDELIETSRYTRLQPYETLLKKFQYQLALDSALLTHNPVVVVTVLEELSRRGGLSIALSGRDEVTLDPLLSFLARYITHPRYTRLLVQMTQRILDLYATVLGQSDTIDELFFKLHRQVKAELLFQKQVMRVAGTLDCVLSCSSAGMARSWGRESDQSRGSSVRPAVSQGSSA